MAYLRDQLGEGVVVRSDDIDNNDIIGNATSRDGAVHRYRAHASDSGEILGAEIDPA